MLSISSRAMPPGVLALLVQAGAGATLYACLALVLELADVRSLLVSRLRPVPA